MRGCIVIVVLVSLIFCGGAVQAQEKLLVGQLFLARAMIEKMVKEGVSFRTSLRVCLDIKQPEKNVACVQSLLASHKPQLLVMSTTIDTFFDKFKPAKGFPYSSLAPITNALAELDVWHDALARCLKHSKIEVQNSCIEEEWVGFDFAMKERQQGAEIVATILKELAEE